VQTLSADLDIPLPCLFFLLPSSKQALLVPAIEEPFVSLAKLEAMATIAIVLLHCLTLELVAPVLVVLLISSTFFYSLSNSYPKQ